MKRQIYKLGVKAPERFRYLRATREPFRSQSEFEKDFGISRATVNRIETGKHGTIRKDIAEKIAVFYNVDVGWLIGEKEDKISLPRPLRNYSYNQTTEQDRTLNVGVGYPDRLRAARKRAGLSQVALAEETGVSEMTIIRHEGGKVLPTKVTFDRLAKALNCDPLTLYGDPGEEKLKDRLTTEEPRVPMGRIRKKREAEQQKGD